MPCFPAKAVRKAALDAEGGWSALRRHEADGAIQVRRPLDALEPWNLQDDDRPPDWLLRVVEDKPGEGRRPRLVAQEGIGGEDRRPCRVLAEIRFDAMVSRLRPEDE